MRVNEIMGRFSLRHSVSPYTMRYLATIGYATMEEARIRCTCRFASLWLTRNACTYAHTRCILGYVCTACCNAVANMPAPPCPIRQSALNTSGTMPIVAWVRYNVVKGCCSNREGIVSREDLEITSVSDVKIAQRWRIASCFEYLGSWNFSFDLCTLLIVLLLEKKEYFYF